MKKATVKLILDERRSKKDGTYPIVLRITHKKLSRYIFTEYSVTEDDWNASEQSVLPGSKKYKNTTRVNNHLHQQLLDASDIITRLTASGEIQGMNVNDVRNAIESLVEATSFKTFAESVIAELKLGKKLGNARYMSQVGDHICKNKPLPKGWEDMTPEEAGYNAIKMMLYYIPLRYISARQERKAIKLYNVYSFGYPLGVDSKEMLWPDSGT